MSIPLGVVRLLTFPTCCPVSAELPVITFVKAPVDGVVLPIEVSSMFPPFMSASSVVKEVNVPDEGETDPIAVPLILPPFISTIPMFTVPFPEPSILDIVKLPKPSIVDALLNNTCVSSAVPIERSVVNPAIFVEKIVPCTLKTAKLDL